MMTVAPIATAAAAVPSTTPRDTGAMGKDDFLKLLVTQLTHQDPMKPMEDREFITQLAQLNALEQMQQVNTNLEALALAQDAMMAASLLGRTVELSLAEGTTLKGEVTQVSWEGGIPRLLVGGRLVALTQVVSVQ